jgi:hypothetical protein
MSVRQKLGVILEIKVFQILILEKKYFTKKLSIFDIKNDFKSTILALFDEF